MTDILPVREPNLDSPFFRPAQARAGWWAYLAEDGLIGPLGATPEEAEHHLIAYLGACFDRAPLEDRDGLGRAEWVAIGLAPYLRGRIVQVLAASEPEASRAFAELFRATSPTETHAHWRRAFPHSELVPEIGRTTAPPRDQLPLLKRLVTWVLNVVAHPQVM